VKLRESRLIRVLGLSSFVLWLGVAGLWFQYDGTRPSSPEPENGRVHSLSTHGHVVYLTLREYVLLNGLWMTAFAGAAAAVGLGNRLKS